MRKTKSGPNQEKGSDSPFPLPFDLIDARIREQRDWRGETLVRVRPLMQQADAEVAEE